MLSRHCPNCQTEISFKQRLAFITKGRIDCPKCGGILSSGIISGSVAVPFGGLAWYWLEKELNNLGMHPDMSIFLGFVACMLIIRLGYPFGTLVYFGKD